MIDVTPDGWDARSAGVPRARQFMLRAGSNAIRRPDARQPR